MAEGLPDWTAYSVMKAVDAVGDIVTVLVDASGAIMAIMKGDTGTALENIKVDSEGRMITVIRDPTNDRYLAVDTAGNIVAVMKGDYAGSLLTMKVDSEGYMVTRLQGKYSGSWVDIAVDENGKLVIKAMSQLNIDQDDVEAQTWDATLSSLLNNMNRIRHQIVAITGEAWGTVTRSMLTIWGKFHASTGHKHTGAADDAPPIESFHHEIDANSYKITSLGAPVADNDAARKADITSLAERTVSTTNFTTDSVTFVDVTDMSVSITLTNVQNVLVFVTCMMLQQDTAGEAVELQILRDATPIKWVKLGLYSAENELHNPTIIVLDPDVAAGSHTYKLQMKVANPTDFARWHCYAAPKHGEIVAIAL